MLFHILMSLIDLIFIILKLINLIVVILFLLIKIESLKILFNSNQYVQNALA